ncbi:MAG: hypothetical protein JWM46_561 [Candidatus Kaiserbacteria bacterium]|nr:hypothetical protein [Candidatus Kaiserbacteria bacterium]
MTRKQEKIIAYGTGILVGTLIITVTVLLAQESAQSITMLSLAMLGIVAGIAAGLGFGAYTTYLLLLQHFKVIELPPRPGASRPRTVSLLT